MTDTLNQSLLLRQSIDTDIAARTAAHQQRIAALRAGLAQAGKSFAAGAAPPKPLVMLAHGDSWFNYPLTGNGLPLVDTDVIAQLGTMGSRHPVILNISHFGDATTDEMALSKQQRMLTALNDASNWLGGKPDAILFSGGGNDIAAERLCIYLDAPGPGRTGLNLIRFDKALQGIEASYLDMLAFRDEHAPGTPVFAHAYDFAIPNGVHPLCSGPWLRPSLEFRGWTDVAAGAAIVKDALTRFGAVLKRLADDPQNNFRLVATQGLLRPADWANELHPSPAGFRIVAGRFVDAMRAEFPGRI